MPPRIIDFAITPDSYIGEYTRANIEVKCSNHRPIRIGPLGGTGGIRSNIVLVLDGKTRFLQTRNLLRYADDGIASFSIPVNGLSFGRHTLEALPGKQCRPRRLRSITFIAGTESLAALMTVEGETAARSEVVLDIDRPDTRAMLMITDADGNTVFSQRRRLPILMEPLRQQRQARTRRLLPRMGNSRQRRGTRRVEQG